jgi:hypothetical protein
MEFHANYLPTAIGSMPHIEPQTVCQIILENFSEIPAWPQLPKRSFTENMYVQYSEGLPCVKIDIENKKIYFDTSTNELEKELEMFYEKYLSNEISAFEMSKEYSIGLYTMIDILKKNTPETIRFIKGAVTGPISFGLFVTDETNKAIIYNDVLFEAIVKGLTMKACWQLTKFKELGLRGIIFLDEPYLSAFGSTYVPLTRDKVIQTLDEMIIHIQRIGGMVGIHCCGNTDWSILLETEVDILSFDAYNFVDTLALYPTELKRFLSDGGMLAWGIVPAVEDIIKETPKTLVTRFTEGIKTLSGGDTMLEEALTENVLITPSCGTGTLSEASAERVVMLTSKLSKCLQGKEI